MLDTRSIRRAIKLAIIDSSTESATRKINLVKADAFAKYFSKPVFQHTSRARQSYISPPPTTTKQGHNTAKPIPPPACHAKEEKCAAPTARVLDNARERREQTASAFRVPIGYRPDTCARRGPVLYVYTRARVSEIEISARINRESICVVYLSLSRADTMS